ncbi:Histidine kinase (fragment) [Verrucomicrobia bacterium]
MKRRTTEPEIVRGKRILIVEDETALREALKVLLGCDGHQIVEARDGKEACLLFTPGDFDLVITDYAMPAMNGDELARTLKCLVPTLPIIMITAYARLLCTKENPVDAILEKPFTISALRRIVAAVLRSEPENIPA